MKKLIFILLALYVVFFLAGCDGGGSGGGGGERGAGGTFVITDVTPHDGIEDFQTVAGQGIKFTAVGVEWFLKDKIELKDNGTLIDKLSLTFDGIPEIDSEYTGTWTQSGTKININLTKEKDNLTGITAEISVSASATLSDDGKTLTADQAHEGQSFKYIYTKQ